MGYLQKKSAVCGDDYCCSGVYDDVGFHRVDESKETESEGE